MKYSKRDIARVLRELEEEGVDVVVIGDTSIQLALGYEELEGDIDLFTIEPSSIVDKEFYYDIASRRNWDISTTEIGTPVFIIPIREGYLIVELYENYMDIDIPLEILRDIVEYKVDNVKIKTIKPEYYIVLKARQGIDLDKLKKHVDRLKQKSLNPKLIEYALSLYPQEEREYIDERLRSIGIEIQ